MALRALGRVQHPPCLLVARHGRRFRLPLVTADYLALGFVLPPVSQLFFIQPRWLVFHAGKFRPWTFARGLPLLQERGHVSFIGLILFLSELDQLSLAILEDLFDRRPRLGVFDVGDALG